MVATNLPIWTNSSFLGLFFSNGNLLILIAVALSPESMDRGESSASLESSSIWYWCGWWAWWWRSCLVYEILNILDIMMMAEVRTILLSYWPDNFTFSVNYLITSIELPGGFYCYVVLKSLVRWSPIEMVNISMRLLQHVISTW